MIPIEAGVLIGVFAQPGWPALGVIIFGTTLLYFIAMYTYKATRDIGVNLELFDTAKGHLLEEMGKRGLLESVPADKRKHLFRLGADARWWQRGFFNLKCAFAVILAANFLLFVIELSRISIYGRFALLIAATAALAAVYLIHKSGWTVFVVISIVLAGLLGAIPLACYLLLNVDSDAYQLARVVAVSLTTGIAAIAAALALLQYHRNSQETRIERSMTFWRRSNSDEFRHNLGKFIDLWAKSERKKTDTDFKKLAKSNTKKDRPTKLAVEYLLDFYDEACTGVLLGACDEKAMFYYLGPLILLHQEKLNEFIGAWRERYDRHEKWDGLTALAQQWRTRRLALKNTWEHLLS